MHVNEYTMEYISGLGPSKPDSIWGIGKLVKVRCVHGDVHEQLLVSVSIKFRKQKHKTEAVVNPRLTHPLFLWTNCPGFQTLVK